MADTDRVKWDQRYAQGGDMEQSAPDWVMALGDEIPNRGTALDIAAGSGRLSLWLAGRGLHVVAVDISPVGLALARQAAEAQGLCIETLAADLETDPLPNGPFDVITCFHYWQGDLFPVIQQRLRPGGVFIAEIATVSNLERHQHPSRQYLAEHGQLRQDCGTLGILHYQEGWFEDRAVARMVARKPLF